MSFKEAPTTLIKGANIQIIDEENVRYHVVNFAGGAFTSTIIESKNAVTLIDLGPAFLKKAGAQLRAYANAIKKPISVIITHNHRDHFGNISHFTDVDVYAQKETAAALMKSKKFVKEYKQKVISVDSSKTINKLEFKFASISNAETKENGYIYIPSVKGLFVGDLLYNKTHNYIREYTPLDDVDELKNWIEGLKELKLIFNSYTHVFVGHNGVRDDISNIINENIAYLSDARGIILGNKKLTSGEYATNNFEVVQELKRLYPHYKKGALKLSLKNAFFKGDKGSTWF